MAINPPRDPRQRLAAALFFLLALVFLFAAALTSKNRIVSEVFLNMGVAIGSVVLIAVLWRFMGGQPYEEAIIQLQRSSQSAAQIASAGVLRIQPERLLGLDERVRDLAPRVAHAKEIDLLGLTLYRNWFQHESLCKALVGVLTANRGRVRIVLVDHERSFPAGANRLVQPGESKAPKLLDGLLDATYSELVQIYNKLGVRERQRLQIRHPDETIVYQTIIRVDDYMFISPYVACAVGDNGFGMEVVGRDHTLYKLYLQEFETMFDAARPTDLTRVRLPDKSGTDKEREDA
jgi:hypothetical protein